eukprot:TRINITY_DN13227_c0_g1_i1.p1 TRINITY_DN13227_c0_g1~~TRINITY_DN13227_c0_g1_i1.p1  ORF type:complete len:108 (-),score=11.39 TRINITY_DN13227_c0_g1_i1:44-337(-)
MIHNPILFLNLTSISVLVNFKNPTEKVQIVEPPKNFKIIVEDEDYWPGNIVDTVGSDEIGFTSYAYRASSPVIPRKPVDVASVAKNVCNSVLSFFKK